MPSLDGKGMARSSQARPVTVESVLACPRFASDEIGIRVKRKQRSCLLAVPPPLMIEPVATAARREARGLSR